MTDYLFQEVPVFDRMGVNLMLARGQKIDVLDTVLDVVSPGLKQSGQPVPYVTTDELGRATFTNTQGFARLRSPKGFERIVHSPQYLDEVHAAPAAAQAAADSAAASAALVGAPAGSAMDAYLGGSASGLVTQVNARARLVAPSGTAAANVTTLQSAVDAAAAAGAPLVVRGVFSVAGQVNIPSGSDIDFSQARITQTASLAPLLVLNNVSDVTLRNPRLQGKTSDYVNNSGVYAAAAIRCTGTTSDVLITGGSLLGFAGLGVYLGAATTGITIRGVRMTGAGSAYILNTTYNFSGGIVTETGASRWSAIENEISGFAQGIVTGDNMTDIRVLGNYIHDIPGQHGLYLETMQGGVVSNNVIRDCALLGMKVQIGTPTVNDATDIVIANNTFRNVGAQGILLDNPGLGAPRFRRIVVADNLITGASGPGIEVRYAVGLHIADNIVSGVTAGAGIRVWSSSQFDVTHNRINTCPQNGIDLKDVTDYEVRGNRIINPGTGNGASTEFGICLDGATSAEGVITDNRITDTLGNMRYGIYVINAVLASHSFRENYAAGATDYGFRGIAATTCRAFDANDFNGTLGRTLNAPTSGGGRGAPIQSFGSAAPTTGAHVVGEVVWNSAPAASGTIGWVCTTAGTPGTWKTFGAISA